MTKDELKKQLKSVGAIKKQLAKKREKLQGLRDNASNITPAYSLAPGGSGTGQKLENAVIDIVDSDVEVQHFREELALSVKSAVRLIALADGITAKLILDKRYLQGKEWWVIAEDMGYSLRRVLQLHGQALDAILKKVNGIERKLARHKKTNGGISSKNSNRINFEEQSLF